MTELQPRSFSLGPPEGTVVYIIYHQNFTEFGSCYTVHALDIDNSHPGDPLPKPILTLRNKYFPYIMGAGRLGSSIYFLGGIEPSVPTTPSLKVYILDTRLLKSTKHPIQKPRTFLKSGPHLNGGKYLPIVVTVDGKLYAISSSFHPSDKQNFPEPRVEVLDPDLGKWCVLPEPIFDTGESYTVCGCDVIGSRIVLWMGSGIVYELDTSRPPIKWRKRRRHDALEEFRTRCGVRDRPGSEVVDGICYPWLAFPRGRESDGLVSFDIARWRSNSSLVMHPIPGEKSPITFEGERRVLDCGGGRAVIFSHGYRKRFDPIECGFGKLLYTLDVVRLEKRADAADHVNVLLEKSLAYKVGASDCTGSLCGCFAINGMTSGVASG